MSHNKDLKLNLEDEGHLVTALENCGVPFERNTIASGYGSQRVKAEFVLRKENISSRHAYGDIACVRQADGTFTIIADDLDMKLPAHRNVVNRIRQGYTLARTKAELTAKGMEIVEERAENGKIVLRARVSQRKARGRNTRTRRAYAGRGGQ